MSHTPRLLLIDEDPSDRGLAILVLSSAVSAPVCEVGDGANFIAALRGGSYDAVVTELGIEGASSAFQLEAIRAIQPGAALIVFTRERDAETRRQALESGASAFIPKSTQGFLDLATVVGEALGLETQTAEVSIPLTASRRTTTVRGTSEARERPKAPASSPQRPVTPPIEPTDRRPSVTARLLEAASPLLKRIRRARRSFDHRVSVPLAIFLGVVAVSALLSMLLANVPADEAPAADGEQPVDVVTLARDRDRGVPAEAAVEPGDEPSGVIDGGATGAAAPGSRPVKPLPDAPIVLQLRATSEVWVRVTADGALVLDRTLKEGQSRVYGADEVAEVMIGNAAGLEVIWNGRNLGSLGQTGQVRRLHFLPTEFGVGRAPETSPR